jgi:hypothetical protein
MTDEKTIIKAWYAAVENRPINKKRLYYLIDS